MEAAVMILAIYKCHCGRQFEQMVKSIEEREQLACPNCGATMRTGLDERIISFHPAGDPEGSIRLGCG